MLTLQLMFFSDDRPWLPGWLQEGPDHQTAFNLVMCAAAMGDAELMRQSFVQLLQVDKQVGKGRVEELSFLSILNAVIVPACSAQFGIYCLLTIPSFANSSGAAICG